VHFSKIGNGKWNPKVFPAVKKIEFYAAAS
jgi:hypothetical protein